MLWPISSFSRALQECNNVSACTHLDPCYRLKGTKENIDVPKMKAFNPLYRAQCPHPFDHLSFLCLHNGTAPNIGANDSTWLPCLRDPQKQKITIPF